MILAQAVLEIFFSQGFIGFNGKVKKTLKKGHNSAMIGPTEKKKIFVRLFFILVLTAHIKFQDPICNHS